MDLLTRGAGFGYLGSTLTSLIYATFTFIFFALEAAIMALAPLVAPTDVYVVTDGRYAPIVREQLPERQLPLRRLEIILPQIGDGARDRHLKDQRLVAVPPVRQSISKFIEFRYAMGFHSERSRESDQVDLRSIDIKTFESILHRLRKSEASSTDLQNLILGVVADEKDNRDLMSRGGP